MNADATTPDPEDRPFDWLTAGPAGELYQCLDSGEGVRRLKDMPQLGAVAWVRPKAQHSRWKYMVRLMHFADRIVGTDRLLGGYGFIPIGSQEYAGRDVIQCWAMLGNIGHLWGTYATERLVLGALHRSEVARETLRALTGPEDQAYLDDVIAKFRIYDLHLGLASVFLELTEFGLPEQRRRWLEMLRVLRDANPRDEKIRKLRAMFQQLRRLAYLSLDLEYADLPVKFDVPTLREQLSDRVMELLREEEGALHMLLTQMNSYIRPEFYLSPDVVKAHAVLQQHGQEVVVEHLEASDPARVTDTLCRMRGRAFWRSLMKGEHPIGYGDYRHLHRITITKQDDRSDDEAFARVPGLKTEMGLRHEDRYLLHATNGVDARQLFLDVFVPIPLGAEDAGRTLCDLCRVVIGSQADRRPPGAPFAVCGQVVHDAVKAILEAALPADFKFSAKPESMVHKLEDFILQSTEGTAGSDGEAHSLSGQITRQLDELGGPNDGPSRHEVRTLRESMAGHRESWKFRLVMLRGFEVLRRSPDSGRVAEIDGAFLDIRPSGARLWLVEAKSGRDDGEKAKAEARRALMEKLGREKLNWYASSGFEDLPGGAEVSVALTVPMRPASY